MQKIKLIFAGALCSLFLAPFFSYAEEFLPEAILNADSLEQNLSSKPPEGLFPQLENPVDTPILQLAVPPSSEWEISPLETFGVRWVIRAKEALNWTLNIKESSNHNPAIEATHQKVLSIVNSLFIVGLLAIAAMWMFSILIPRKQLKRVMLVYAGAVVFVNFALPFNQLLVDGTQVLQRTLLTGPNGNIVISDLIQTPDYTQSVVYEKQPEALKQGKTVTHQIKINPAQEGAPEGVTLATVHSQEKTLIGSLIQGDELGQMQFNIPESKDESLQLNTQEQITFEQTVENTSLSESQVFSFILMMATGLAYFVMAMVFVLRWIMLWALLILSPGLLLLAIFNSTRGWFLQWVAVYGRWLMIGPLMALGLSVVINLWQLTGSPVEVGPFAGQTFAESPVSTLAFYLPGHSEPNTLANTNQVMEYLLFLLMLYLPVFFAFALTRQRAVHAIGTWLKDYGQTLKKSTTVILPQVSPSQEKTDTLEKHNEDKNGLVRSIKNTLGEKLQQFTQMAMPTQTAERKSHEEKISIQKALMAALPLSDLLHQVQVEPNEDKKGPVTENKAILKKLAFPERSLKNEEHQQLMSLRQEIEKRAKEGHAEAQTVWVNIQTIQNQDSVNNETKQNAPSSIAMDEGYPEQTVNNTLSSQKEIEKQEIRESRESRVEKKTEAEEKILEELPKKEMNSQQGQRDSRKKTGKPKKEEEKKQGNPEKEEETDKGEAEKDKNDLNPNSNSRP